MAMNRVLTNLLVAALVFLGFLRPCAAADQNSGNTRQGQMRDARKEKSKHLVAEQTSGTEKKMYWLETSLQTGLRFNIKNFYPRFASLSTGSGFAPGVRYWKPKLHNSAIDLQISAAYSLKGYQLYEFEFGKTERKSSEYFLNANSWGGFSQAPRIPSFQPTSYLYLDLRYRNFPQEDYFGLGPDSLKIDRTDYRLKDELYDVVAGYQFNRWAGTGFRLGYLHPDISDGTDRRFPDISKLFTDATAPGLTDQPNFIRLNSTLFFDYRDTPGNPHQGGIFGISFSRYEDLNVEKFSFHRFAFDAREYVPLGSVQRVAAFRFFTSFDNPGKGSTVPFYLMETLGGSETLRGFREFRFRDRNLFYLSGEYRWEGAPGLEFAVFYDAGKVFPDASDFGFNKLERSYGFGVRFKTSDSVFLRIDYGRSNEGSRISFKFGPSF